MFVRKRRNVDPTSAVARQGSLAAGLSSAGLHAQHRPITGAVTALAALAALLLAVALPATTFLAERYRMEGALETSARLYAADVAIVGSETPGFWSWRDLRISSPGTALAGGASPSERRRVYDSKGRLILETTPATPLKWPVLSQRTPIIKGHSVLGEAEASRSFRGPLLTTVLVGLCSSLLGVLIFVLLRVVPLRLLREALARASYLSAHDVLTGLPNRALFADRLDQALAVAPRSGRRVAVLYLDLDHFKEINDTLGHAAGDTLLRVMATRLTSCLREGDTLSRVGGDEFTIIQVHCHHERDAEVLASRLLEAVALPIEIDGDIVHAGLSIGIALSEPGSTAGDMLKNADMALYQAKASGRNQCCFFAPEMNTRILEQHSLEADLRTAVAENQFCLHFQPLVDIRAGDVLGAEALLRWDRPGHGWMPPDQFIETAESVGLIGPIGRWVLQEACRTAASWPDDLTVAVNVSPVQFRTSDFPRAVIDALQESGLPPSRLELEITEGVLLNDTEDTLAVLAHLRDVGVRLVMDDFGTGYSSLGYLQKFRFDKIKIDRRFVDCLDRDVHAAAIVRAVIALGEAMGVRTNAEGIETQDEARILLLEGCREGQGYLYGRPMPAAAFMGMLSKHPVD